MRAMLERGKVQARASRGNSTCNRMLQNRPRVGCTIYYYRKDPPFLSGGPPTHTYRFVRNACRQRKDVSRCQRLVKRKEIIYLKVIQT